MKFHLNRYPNNESPKPILTPREHIAWESKAVFNPSVIYDNGVFKMLYRTYPKDLQLTESRVTRPGFKFAYQISYIGYAESKDGIHFERRETPFLAPDTEYDGFGCEDPRITKIGDIFYITYTAIDSPTESKVKKPNVRIALATTKDFLTVEKHGIIGPPAQSKASAFFPEIVNGGQIGLLMTVSSDSVNSKIVVKYYDSTNDIKTVSKEEWSTFLFETKAVIDTEWWLQRGPELGASPIKTEKGWLIIFSSESMSASWTVSAALLDLENPSVVIARTPGSILEPATEYEREGLVPNVTFPEGVVIVEEDLYVYYGCADTVIGLATCKVNDLLEYLENFKGKQ